MLRSLSTIVVSLFCAVALSACAANLDSAGGIGASSQPLTKKSKRLAAKNCRAAKRELRRLESKREVGSKAYDKAIARYTRYGCENGRV